MKLGTILAFLLVLMCIITPAHAADLSAASCSSTAVQNAINSARDGDRVLVPAGNCTWSSQVVVEGKGITLQGAGIGQTVITNGRTSSAMLAMYLDAGDPVTYVTGFTFNANNLDTGSNPMISVSGGGLNQFRFHHFEITNLRERGIVVSQDGLAASGLIDSCTINMPTTSGSKGISVFGTGAQEHQPFSFPLGLGTNRMVYVEDCTFNYGGRNDGAIDAYAGARYVFRYNTVNNTNVEHHGADSGGYRGTMAFEVYGNTFTNNSADMRKHYFRSGTGVVFDNTYSGNYGSAELTNYRSDESMAPFGICNGSSSWDENRPGAQGYACLDQIGHVFGSTSGGSNTLVPMYAWNNIHSGSQVRFVVGTSHANANIHIVENRDFYNYTANFNGTAGVGRGSLSSRPTTCTVGVAYWATDTNALYRCSNSNTWTTHYTPYTYPHPLRGVSPPTASPPAAPSNLGVR